MSQEADTSAGMHTPAKGGIFSRGLIVFLILAVLTAVEYAIAKQVDQNIPPLAVIALIKAGLIVWYFMHVVRAWRSHEEAD